MTNPMPEAVTGDLIRWALTILRTASTSDAGPWTRELERLRPPSHGGAEVDVGRLSPPLRGFLRTLQGSSLAPDLDPASIEPVLDPIVQQSDDAPEDGSPLEEPLRRVILVVDCERSGRSGLDPEFRDALFLAVAEACSRIVGWDDYDVGQGNGAIAVLPRDAGRESIARWCRLMLAGLSREQRPRYMAGVLGTHLPNRRVLWDLRRKIAYLKAARDEFVARQGPGPVLVLPEPLRNELTGQDGRTLGIGRWEPVVLPPGSAYRAWADRTCADRTWAAPWRPTPAGRPPDDALRRLARAARQVAGRLTRVRIGYGTRADLPWAVDEVCTAAKQLSADLENLADDVSEPGLRSVLLVTFRHATDAALELALITEDGVRGHAERAEHRLYVVTVLLHEIVGDDDEEEPVHERPPVRRSEWLLPYRQPDLWLSAASRISPEGN
ncbi:hypothetical protein [Kitasatospora sp. NPDC093558]|uniref:hypothetical protein n=1 Tax=Kitasatospora sp. NPDC093558 TaxID=3155201 RepID=UPI0034393820